jgi:hypothetical protein
LLVVLIVGWFCRFDWEGMGGISGRNGHRFEEQLLEVREEQLGPGFQVGAAPVQQENGDAIVFHEKRVEEVLDVDLLIGSSAGFRRGGLNGLLSFAGEFVELEHDEPPNLSFRTKPAGLL